ncbi:hypothetical protein BSW63_22900 [Salmonella enterica subsp. enterica serovar Enteritidis]|nr:hypothetical protein [Salmonella enterica subsp. enterica serovar Enteritidis]ELC7077843.1 hypothetical protein [Salmonella enterica]
MSLYKILGIAVVLISLGSLGGCVDTGAVAHSPQQVAASGPLPITQGMLEDLNQCIYQLIGQQKSGNAEAGKVLMRLVSGEGFPVSKIRSDDM